MNLSERYRLREAAAKLLPNESVALCGKRRQSHGRQVQILFSPTVKTTFFGNLQSCASLWSCPVCASKITERRRVPLQKTILQFQLGRIMFLTFTVAHSFGDDVALLLQQLRDASRKMKQSTGWRQFKADCECVGQYTSLETTYGNNGFHPHMHSLFFFGRYRPLSLEDVKRAVYPLWKKALKSVGRSCSRDFGLHVRAVDERHRAFLINYMLSEGLLDGDDIKRQWTASHELVKSQSKKSGKHGSRTMLQLLSDYVDKGDKQAGYLWSKYALTFKGYHHIHPSRGLKKLLGLDFKTDKQLHDEFQQQAFPVAELPLDVLKKIDRYELRPQFLDATSRGRGFLLEWLHDYGLLFDVDVDQTDWLPEPAGMDW